MKTMPSWLAETIGAIAVTAVLLGAHACTTQAAEVAVYRPAFGEAQCRDPNPGTEYLVTLHWCETRGECFRSCSIEPRQPDRAPAKSRKQSIERKKG